MKLNANTVQELLNKCHPLGMFDSIENMLVANDLRYFSLQFAEVGLFKVCTFSIAKYIALCSLMRRFLCTSMST